MKVSAVVPAFNEAGRIGAVIRALRGSPSVTEVIVVDDGSADETALEAKKHGADVVRLLENSGKAAALDAGVRKASEDVLLFLDADLTGLAVEHVEQLVNAYAEDNREIVIGIFREGRRGTDFSQRVVPFLSGQRVLSRQVWDRARGMVGDMDFGIEVALTKLALKEGWRQTKVSLDGVSHVRKEEKRGAYAGLLDRLSMYWDILRSLVRKL
ncbi:MAG: glycosyltransferase family 2 protein [Candidatus Bipolaricaulota bacterium]